MVRWLATLALTIPGALACASTPSPESPGPAGSGTAVAGTPVEDEDAPLPPSDIPEIVAREAAATKHLETIKANNPTDEQAGRLAMSALSEEMFQLPPEVRKAMEPIWTGGADAAQTGVIALAMADGDDILKQSMSRRCGKSWPELLPAFEKLSPKEKTTMLLNDCGGAASLKLDPALADRLNWGSVLLSMSVLNLLEVRGRISPDERALARKIAHAFRADQKT